MLLAICVATTLIYLRGVSSGEYFFDDKIHLNDDTLKIDSLSLQSLRSVIESGRAGPTGRPLAMLSFGIEHALLGELSAPNSKKINLAIHLLNIVVVFGFMVLVFMRASKLLAEKQHLNRALWFAFVVTAAWALHPIQVSAVVYPIQRMTSLSATFSLVSLLLYLWLRTTTSSVQKHIAVVWVLLPLFLCLSTYTKENGVLTILFLFLVEWIILRFRCRWVLERRSLIVFYGVFLALPILWLTFYTVLIKPEWILSGYQYSVFSLPERLLTEARVVASYILTIVLPTTSNMGFFHDDVSISRSLIEPLSTLASVLLHGGLLGLAIFKRKQWPLFALGITFFYAGHLVESTVIALELKYEHRNYLPSVGLILALADIFFRLAQRLPQPKLLWIVAGLWFVNASLHTYLYSSAWSQPFTQAVYMYSAHPHSPRANNNLGEQYDIFARSQEENKDKYYKLAISHFEKAFSLSEENSIGLFYAISLSQHFDEPRRAAWMEELKERLANERLEDNSVDWIVKYMNNYMEDRPSADAKYIRQLVDAVLSNSSIPDSARETLLGQASQFSLMAQEDSEAAYTYAHELWRRRSYRPDIGVYFAALLQRLECPAQSKEVIELTQRNDSKEKFAQQLNNLASRLSAFEIETGLDLTQCPAYVAKSMQVKRAK